MRLIRLLKNDLAREISHWLRDGIINADQASQLFARYGIDPDEQARHSYGYYILIALGYLFFGLAVIVLLSANWDDIPRGLRMAMLIIATLAANFAGLYHYRHSRTAGAVLGFFLGGLLYGASIVLIAQIYHIGEHFPDGIYWWALGTLPAALLLKSRLLMLLPVVLAFIWFFTETSMEYYPTTFPLFIIALGWQLFRQKQSNLLFLVFIAAMGVWLEYALGWQLGDDYFDFDIENLALGGGLFIAFYGWAQFLASRDNPAYQDYGSLLALWVLRFALITLLVMSFSETWQEFLGASWQHTTTLLILVALLCAAAVGLCYLAGKPVALISAVAIIYLAILSLSANMPHYIAARQAVTFQVLDNILLITTGIWLIVQGIREGISHYFFLGVSTILLTGLLRYIDLIGDYVGTSMLFALFAIILLVAAHYWKSLKQKGGTT